MAHTGNRRQADCAHIERARTTTPRPPAAPPISAAINGFMKRKLILKIAASVMPSIAENAEGSAMA